MCRLFGFMSSVPTRVHRSLVSERNSLMVQSREHKDGWGIAHYANGPLPAVAHGLCPAHADPEFERVSGLLSSRAVLAHIRLASVGRVHTHNTHPFLHERWAFAHNGTLREFTRAQAAIEARIAPHFRKRIQGETDSERCFFLFLTLLERSGGLVAPSVEDVARALAETAHCVVRLTEEPGTPVPTSTNFLVTNGELMVATRRHRTLFFSEQPGQVLIASEELSFEEHWHPIPEGSVIAVDREMKLRRWAIAQLAQGEA
jgi:glutamine amidotransferase